MSGDTETEFVVDRSGKQVTLARGASDACLTAYHVDRSKIVCLSGSEILRFIDAERVAEAIEFYSLSMRARPEPLEGRLGAQIGAGRGSHRATRRPDVSRKANALYFEFEEVGMNRTARVFVAGRV